ncbi:hypothetical protein GGF46_004706 [Coemansia sp. RSA 552]|nr:hypothetical protein GGF46_004706 [Coemansia sp. RSA 552]
MAQPAAASDFTDLTDLTDLFSLDNADNQMIQELLARIPSTAWVPTDPLTSEGWFPDVAPPETVLGSQTQPPDGSSEAYLASDPASLSTNASALKTADTGMRNMLPAAVPNNAALEATKRRSIRPRKGAKSTTLDAASSSQLPHATPDARLLASVRSKRGETSLISRGSGAKRGNPLRGFAKKHGVGYAVGNQMAVISPELLSPSPPNARQLRTNPYRYYSPPKHSFPRSAVAKTKGRNLMLGKALPKQQSAEPQKQAATSRGASVIQPRSKWVITQDKLLLHGVRLLRWKDGSPPRDPGRFTATDWEGIAEGVNAAGVVRSARQCRRRWAVMHAHLDTAIMDFVDSTPTPQSSAQSTPVAPPDSACSNTAGVGPSALRHRRNLDLANLPKSSPPLPPTVPGQDALGPPNDRGPSQDQPQGASKLGSSESFDLQELNIEGRWSEPAYCQLLADVVQAITNPGSEAAAVVRRRMSGLEPAEGSVPRGVSKGAAEVLRQLVEPKSQPAKAASVPTSRLPSAAVPDLSSLLPICTTATTATTTAAMAQESTGISAPLLVSTVAEAVVTAQPAMAASTLGMAGGMTRTTDDVDLGNIDQEVDVYTEFLRQLGIGQGTLDNELQSLFGEASMSLASGAPVPVASNAALASSMTSTGQRSSVLTAAPVDGTSSGQPVGCSTGVDDDDVNDDDFVLDDDDIDDDDDDDDDDDEGSLWGGPKAGDVLLSKAGPYPSTLGAAGEGNSWELTLKQLGWNDGAQTTEPLAGVQPGADLAGIGGSADGSGPLLPESIIQQLIHDVASNSKSAETVPGAVASAAAQQDWLAEIAADSSVFTAWTIDESSGTGEETGAAEQAGEDAAAADGSVDEDEAAQSTSALTDAKSRKGHRHSSSASRRGAGRAISRSSSNQNQLQKLISDMATPTTRGLQRASRRRVQKMASAASSSIVQALSAGAVPAADTGADPTAIDTTEMSGLYQDALQEGEQIDMRDRMADNSDLLFTGEQMRQLREQQVQNFQLVLQGLLTSCSEVGPHDERSRHWKRQIDQLALWHSLGTRESPTDLMTADGLGKFGDLIESAEHRYLRTGTVGITESGRFAPNPASFFAIPGITAVIPDMYEAIDELHRATQLSNEHYRYAEASDGTGASANIGASAETRTTAHRAQAEAEAAAAITATRGKETVRSFDRSLEFTRVCECTAIAPDEFKSPLVLETVFPAVYLNVRNSKRKMNEAASEDSVFGTKFQALQPSPPVKLDVEAMARATAQGMKPLAPLNPDEQRPPPSRCAARQPSSGSAAGKKGPKRGLKKGRLSLIKPLAVSEEPPRTYTHAEIWVLMEEMRAQLRLFNRELHRVPRTRRRVFVQGLDGVPRLDWMRVNITPLTLPLAMRSLLTPLLTCSGFQEPMLPQIVAVRKPKNRIHFLETEDALLCRGLRLFGIDDVASVRVHTMPCKTASQLRNRLNNLRARRAPPNPVKEYCLRRITPLTIEEEEILRIGMLVYGEGFKQMDQSFLTNRPNLALTHMWSQSQDRHSPEPSTAA